MIDRVSTYEHTLHWLYQQLPMYQRVGAQAYKADLEKTWALVQYLNDPHKSLRTIHVAGTNGKGSTSHMLASILQEAGYRVGLYTSPHLKDFRERIRINGEMIPKDIVTDFVCTHQEFFQSHQLSFFEMTVGLALQYFKDQEIDIAVIEVGMGGRLDSTNIISPDLSVITNIGYDHMAFLGTSLSAIAYEKAGIIKPGIPVIIGESLPETRPVFEEVAQKNNAPIIYCGHEEAPYLMDLKGDYQRTNQRTVLSAIEQLNKMDWCIEQEHVKSGLAKVVTNTHLLGRWQKLNENPIIICDTAHNAHGLKITMAQLRGEQYNDLHVVIGFVNDKDLHHVLTLMPKEAYYYFCAPDSPRALPPIELAKAGAQIGLKGEVYSSVELALSAAKMAAGDGDFIYVGGSTFVVAEVL
ncbi:bifunctional folylpolyglutamate synthase/dihydrofolate synthase [Flavobacteriaceae bacterium]|nr:bifunctional folylpolyglutamate synthase/dihydrofolate synthase [Flavobacteriaceae bacterium]